METVAAGVPTDDSSATCLNITSDIHWTYTSRLNLEVFEPIFPPAVLAQQLSGQSARTVGPGVKYG